ncbi:MAG: [Fe-Fe] hydrogenase large subunit C-terminal domain-containing protein [Desulfosalsimonadaceae bacterium]
MPMAYVQFDASFCTGCAKCVRACPTKAIRIRGERAVLIEHLCIGCGECIRVCPEGAVISAISSGQFVKSEKFSVAIISPILYSQFPGVMPCDVLLGLNHIGFDHAIDLSYYLEMHQYAAEEFIVRNRETGENPWPLISPICPVICRLIALKYPDLLDHILPLKRPVALIGEGVRSQIAREFVVAKEDVQLYHLTPCASKMISAGIDVFADSPCMDAILGINDIYPQLSAAVEQIKNMELCFYPCQRITFLPNARAPMWGMSGGEIAGMNVERVLAVDGLQEVIQYIEKIDMGLFKDMEYIELRACSEGCLGGSFTAVDKYIARSSAQKLIKMFGVGRRIQRGKLRRIYDQGWFHSSIEPEEMFKNFLGGEPPLTIGQMQQIEEILEKVPGKDCGICGAPDCRTFAEDVVRGRAELRDCYWFQLDKN